MNPSDTQDFDLQLTQLSASIVAAYVSTNTIAPAEVPTLIAAVHRSLGSLSTKQAEEPAPPQVPAVPVKKSVTPEYIICLEDGKQFKSLKRHLRTSFNLSPEEYRAKWGLPGDYPMVAPNYAVARSELAKKFGLGQIRQEAA